MIAEHFGCTRQGVHNAYYREKIKSILPFTTYDQLNKYELKNTRDVTLACDKRGITLAELVNEEVEKRFIKDRVLNTIDI